jgi:hypothetical protein
MKIPAGSSWVALTRELLESSAWSGMSVHCFRFITFLLIDHCSHAGRENGRLQATYDQLTKFGIPRKRIFQAIQEAETRGLVQVTRRGGLYGLESCRTPSHYRLTWMGAFDPCMPATNEWRRFRAEKISPHPHAGTARLKNRRKEAA